MRWDFGRERAQGVATCRDHELRAFVERFARIVERVDRRVRLKMQIARWVDAREHVSKNGTHIVNVEARRVGDEEILRERELTLSEDCVGLRKELHRTRRLRIRRV